MKHTVLALGALLTFSYCGNTQKALTSSGDEVNAKYVTGECDAAMKFISSLWNHKGNDCANYRGIAAFYVAEFVNEHDCYKGMHVRNLLNYLGPPDSISNKGYRYSKGFFIQRGIEKVNFIIQVSNDTLIEGITYYEDAEPLYEH